MLYKLYYIYKGALPSGDGFDYWGWAFRSIEARQNHLKLFEHALAEAWEVEAEGAWPCGLPSDTGYQIPKTSRSSLAHQLPIGSRQVRPFEKKGTIYTGVSDDEARGDAQSR
jgi:hypothetical protein